MTRPANVLGSSICSSVWASLWTPKSTTRAFSERKAHTLLILQRVSSHLFTVVLAFSPRRGTQAAFELRPTWSFMGGAGFNLLREGEQPAVHPAAILAWPV